MISLISLGLIIFYIYSTFYIYMLGHHSYANHIFLALNINFALSSLANYMLLNAQTYEDAFIWLKIYRFAILPVPVLLLAGIMFLAFPNLNKKAKPILFGVVFVIACFWFFEGIKVAEVFYDLYKEDNLYRWRIRWDNIYSIVYNLAFILLYIPSIIFSLWWLKRYVLRATKRWAKQITILFVATVAIALMGVFQYFLIVKDGLYNGIFYFILVGMPISLTYFLVFQERKLPLVTLNTYSEKIVDSLNEGVLLFDENFRLLHCNTFAQNIIKFNPDKTNYFADFDKDCYNNIKKKFKGKPLINEEGTIQTFDDKELKVSYAFSELDEKKDKQNGYLFIFMDITKAKDMEKRLIDANEKLNEQIIWRTTVINERNNALLREMKQKEENRERIEYFLENDYMTELYNKNGFLNVVNFQKDILHRTLISIDIINFRLILESFSRLIAERLIVEMSDYLKSRWQRNVVMARFETSRFLLYCNREDAESIAKDILRNFRREQLIDGFKIEVECGIGIAYERFEGQDINQMIIEADLATDEARKYGSHQYYIYSEEMDVKNSAEFLMLNDYLYVALNENKLQLQYKLRFDINGKPIGMIALIRWQIRKDRVIEEREIIGIAEKHNFSQELEIWRMKQLVKDIGYLLSVGKGFCLPIMIRISKSVYYNEDHLNQLIKILDENEIDKSMFEFALGEEIFRETTIFNLACLANIRKHNIKVGLEHFGGLYSSLKYLKNLEIDFIVPAPEFIEGIGTNERDEAILRKILGLAQSMNYNIVIQTVSEKNKLSFLAEYCNDFAGKYFFEAGSIESVIECLRRIENGEIKCEYFQGINPASLEIQELTN